MTVLLVKFAASDFHVQPCHSVDSGNVLVLIFVIGSVGIKTTC